MLSNNLISDVCYFMLNGLSLCISLLVLLYFLFSIYGFWLPLWYLQTLLKHVKTVMISSQEGEMWCICVLGVSSKEGEMSCICVLGVFILPLSTIFRYDLRTVPTVWYFLFVGCHLIIARQKCTLSLSYCGKVKTKKNIT